MQAITPEPPSRVAETRYLPWRHRRAFLNVGYDLVCAIFRLLNPANREEAQFALQVVLYIRGLRAAWRAHNRAPFYRQSETATALINEDSSLSPWTTPSIEDFSAVLETMLYNYTNRTLIAVMGYDWHDWQGME
ncbi:hypothetical protein N7492_009989 [Penicillium capsulatum]|uniref:Uncharacterized protein n=1 Tax=Penicillium capsulatum TaxID=69766 RepID=A0A9W9HQ95_9EURO|nr:hypothetical protein N7492_009989 [Penicillium capsulatum]KAJ6112498.1 hypothetical protein N7512_007822 [Penicillium capsulatum]